MSPETTSNHPLSDQDRVWAIPIVLCFVLVGLLASTPMGNYDLGTDLKTGQWILQNRSFPAKDNFTYTCNQNDYLDGKVLYQILLYLGYCVAGYKGLSLANTAAVLLVFYLLWFRFRLVSSPPWLACLLLTAAALGLERRFFIKAEIASWILLSLTFLVLELYRKGHPKALWLLPALQLVWANTEGLFILGWLVTGAYLLSSWEKGRGPDKRLLLFGGCSLLASLLNPYGFQLWTLPFQYFSQFKDSANSDLVSPLRFLESQDLKIDWNIQVFIYFGYCLLLALGLGLSWRKRKIHEWLLAAVFFYLSCVGYRNIPFFLLATLPLLAGSWGDGAARLSVLNRVDSFLTKSKLFPAISALFVLLTALRICTNAYYAGDRRQAHLGLGLDEERVPVQAVEFLNRNHLEGRMLNYIGMGDWLIWQWDRPVFIDGRQQVISPELYEDYKQSFTAGGLARLMLLYNPQLVALQYNDAAPWAIQLKFMPDWRLIEVDESSALYARKDYATQLPAFSFPALLQERGLFPDLAGASALVQNIQPSKWGAWFSGFYRPQHYPMGLTSLGLLALHYEDYPTAEAFFAEALRRAGGGYAELFYNLGVAELRLQRYHLGKICLEKSLVLDPGNPNTLKMLDGLRND